MIDNRSHIESVSKEIIRCYKRHEYEKASEKMKMLMGLDSEHYSLQVYVDYAHLLCLSGKYGEAQPILKRLIGELESSKDPDNDILEKLYLAYANCLFNHNDYIRFHYYIHKYLSITKESNPDAYSYIKKMLSEV